MGILGNSRPEWILTDLACAHLGGTTVGIYETFPQSMIEFIINQTQMNTITCSSAYLSQLIAMKNQGSVESRKYLISMSSYDYSIEEEGKVAGIKVMHINEVVEHGRKHSKTDIE